MKKITSLVIKIILLVGLVSGCQKSEALMADTIATLMEEASSFEVETLAAEYTAEALVFIEEQDIKTDYSDEIGSYDTKIILSETTASIEGEGAEINEGLMTISQAGSYELSGSFQGQILIEADEEADIQLIFNGVNLSSSESSPLYIASADTVVITLVEASENTIYDGSSYIEDISVEGEADIERLNGAIHSKDDLIINGLGSLSVEAVNKSGILGKDDVKILGGSITITAERNGIKGKELFYMADGQLKIEAGTDGIESDEMVYIAGGEMEIISIEDALHSDMDVLILGGQVSLTSEDDGIHGDASVQIDGGIINILDSYEGLEGQYVIINDGEININASDDGINTADGTVNEGGRQQGPMFDEVGDFGLYLNGGTLMVNSYGDGLDSNGNIWMTGGVVIVSGPTTDMEGSIDYNGTFEMTGGYLVTSGSSGMMQSPSEVSTINTLVIVFDDIISAGTSVIIRDVEGQVLMNYSPVKDFKSIQLATPNLEIDESYMVYVDGNTYATIEMTSSLTFHGEATMINQPMGGHTRPGMDTSGDMTLPEGMERPEGMEFLEGMEAPEGMILPSGEMGPVSPSSGDMGGPGN